jgi:hypothetical protein
MGNIRSSRIGGADGLANAPLAAHVDAFKHYLFRSSGCDADHCLDHRQLHRRAGQAARLLFQVLTDSDHLIGALLALSAYSTTCSSVIARPSCQARSKAASPRVVRAAATLWS